MIELDDTHRRLARSGTHEQLAAAYQEAAKRGAAVADNVQVDEVIRPIAVPATAIPPAATLNVAIHLIHVLPDGAQAPLFEELITTAEKNAADALHRCHRALDLDSEDHGYTAEEWLATVYDIATTLLESAHRDHEPPTVVRQAQEAISWLSRAIVDLDQGSAEATTAIVEAMLACSRCGCSQTRPIGVGSATRRRIASVAPRVRSASVAPQLLLPGLVCLLVNSRGMM